MSAAKCDKVTEGTISGPEESKEVQKESTKYIFNIAY